MCLYLHLDAEYGVSERADDLAVLLCSLHD